LERRTIRETPHHAFLAVTLVLLSDWVRLGFFFFSGFNSTSFVSCHHHRFAAAAAGVASWSIRKINPPQASSLASFGDGVPKSALFDEPFPQPACYDTNK
jgi:hypothetical protein